MDTKEVTLRPVCFISAMKRLHVLETEGAPVLKLPPSVRRSGMMRARS